MLSLLQRHSRKHDYEVAACILASSCHLLSWCLSGVCWLQAFISEGGAQVVHGCLVQQVEPQLLEAALHLVRAACSLATQPEGELHARMAVCTADSKCQAL